MKKTTKRTDLDAVLIIVQTTFKCLKLGFKDFEGRDNINSLLTILLSISSVLSIGALLYFPLLQAVIPLHPLCVTKSIY